MSSKVSISVILSWQLSAILAQQACYWPNGSLPPSDQTVLVNCYSSEESICCGQGDMCMSNGLCIGGQGGTVWIIYSLYAPNSDLEYLMGRRLIRKWRPTEGDAQTKLGAT